MKMRVKALRSVTLLAGMLEAGQECDVEERDHSGAMVNIDAGHLELLSLEDDEPTAAGDDPSGSQQGADTGDSTDPSVAGDAAQKRKGGRPKGSKNKPSVPPTEPDAVSNDGNVSNPDQPEDAPTGV